MYAAAAARDTTTMHQMATSLLQRSDVDQLSPYAREQVLVIAQLGAIGSGKPAEVPQIDRSYGRDIRPSARFGPVRRYLLAWADAPVQKGAAAGGR